LAVPRPPPSGPPTSCISTAPSPMMQSLAIFLRPPAAVRSPTFRRRRGRGRFHAAPPSPSAATSARFLPTGSTLRLFFYTRRTTVSRACSIGSVDNKALHVPVTSGGIGRLHLLPIAYCLPIAHLLPSHVPTVACSAPAPRATASLCMLVLAALLHNVAAGNRIVVRCSLISLSRPPIHGHHPHQACACAS
jgi:hypothetical protein